MFTGEKGKDKLLYHGPGKGKCVEKTCKKKEDCKNQDHSGFDCVFHAEYGHCQCKKTSWGLTGQSSAKIETGIH